MSTSIRYLRMVLHTPDRVMRPIGYLSSYGDIYRVSFDDDYINDVNRPTLSLSYQGENEAATSAILRAQRDERVSRIDGKWPVYFQNLLPEGHNRERLAKERQCGTDDEFELLAAAGHDLMGAIEVAPVPADESVPDIVRVWHTTLGLDVLEPGFVENPIKDGYSIPGVVTKFSALNDGKRYVAKRHGAAGDFIIKLPTTTHPDLVENELTGYALLDALEVNCARALKISKEEAELPVQVPFPSMLAVQRFDRGPNGQRIHMEEFAQILQFPPKHKYGNDLVHDYSRILLTLENLSADPAADTVEFVRRFIAFILMGNTDAHLKNWAVIYPDGRIPRLSPAYDPVCVTSYFDDVPEQDYQMNRAIDKKLCALTWENFETLLTRAKVARKNRLMQVARHTVRNAKSRWPALLESAPQNIKDEITVRLEGSVVLARDTSA